VADNELAEDVTFTFVAPNVHLRPVDGCRVSGECAMSQSVASVEAGAVEAAASQTTPEIGVRTPTPAALVTPPPHLVGHLFPSKGHRLQVWTNHLVAGDGRRSGR